MIFSRHNHNPDRSYRQIVAEIREYADEHGREKATRAVADGLEDTLRPDDSDGGYIGHLPVDGRTGGQVCIARLKDGMACRHHGRRSPNRADGPPHKPPHSDHADLWLQNGEPVAYTMHLYDLHTDYLRDIVGFADEWDYEVMVDPASWYFPTHTTHVVFYNPPEGKDDAEDDSDVEDDR